MSYSPDIQDRYNFISNQFETKKKWLEDLVPIINERAEAEIAYSKSLEKVAIQYEKFTQKNNLEQGIVQIVMSARSAILGQSEQSIDYADLLKGEVIDSLKAGIKKQQRELATLKQKADFLKTQLQRSLEELTKQKPHYYKNYKMFIKNKEIIQSLSLPENSRVTAALKENEKQLQGNQKVIDESLKEYNSFLDQYFTEIALTNYIQDTMEDFRIEKVKDAIMKSLIYQMSAIKNVEYDSLKISEKIENYKRLDPKPIFTEMSERTMLSKLNTQNYLLFLHSECQYPEVDAAISKMDSKNLESGNIEISKSLKLFNDTFGPKQIPNGNNNLNGEFDQNSQENYFPNLLNNIFFKQTVLDNNTTQQFKDRIDLQEKERLLFTLALDNFSPIVSTSPISVQSQVNDKSMSDLLLLISLFFEKCEASCQCELIERCYFNYLQIADSCIKDEKQRKELKERIQELHAFSSKDLWIQDSVKKINSTIQRDDTKFQISKTVFAEQQIRQGIQKWKQMRLTQTLQIEIMKGISIAFQVDEDKQKFYENVILDKQKIQKKPIFGNNNGSQQSDQRKSESNSTDILGTVNQLAFLAADINEAMDQSKENKNQLQPKQGEQIEDYNPEQEED